MGGTAQLPKERNKGENAVLLMTVMRFSGFNFLRGSKRRYSNSSVISLFSSGFDYNPFILLVMAFTVRDKVTSELYLGHSELARRKINILKIVEF